MRRKFFALLLTALLAGCAAGGAVTDGEYEAMPDQWPEWFD